MTNKKKESFDGDKPYYIEASVPKHKILIEMTKWKDFKKEMICLCKKYGLLEMVTVFTIIKTRKRSAMDLMDEIKRIQRKLKKEGKIPE